MKRGYRELRKRTYVLLQALNLLNTVVADIELLEALQLFQALELRDPIRLNGQDAQLLQAAEIL